MSSASDFVIENGVLKEYKGHEKEIEIPENVTTIGASVFKGRKSMESVKIPASVTRIRESAFSGCSGLTRIEIPESVTRIDDRAFAHCKGLTEITIPKNVNIMGKSICSGCQNLTKVTILCRTVGEHAFYDCGDIDVYIPNGLQYAEPAFGGCNCSLHIWRWGQETARLIENGQVEIIANDFKSLPVSYRMRTALKVITLDNFDFESDCGKEVIDYLKKNSEKMCSSILNDIKALSFMCENKLIPAKYLDLYLQEATNRKNAEANALLLNYQNHLGKAAVAKARAQKEKKQQEYTDALVERISARDPSKGIEGMTFVITGKLQSWASREETEEWLDDYGAKMGKSVTKETDYLVTNDAYSGSEKNRKAQELGVSVIDEAEFNHMIGKKYRNDESITVPGWIGKISDKAFAGNGETRTVTFEDGIAYIGNYAFSRCFSLTAVFIPTSVRFISHNAFWQAEKVTIHAVSGSYAHNYARRHKIPIITE